MAHEEALVRVYVGNRGNRLQKLDVYVLDGRQGFIIRIRYEQRTVLAALPTIRTQGFINVAGLLEQMNLELAGLAFDLLDLSQSDNFYVGMSGRLNEPGGQDSDRTVIRRKGLVKGSHAATYSRGFLRQIDMKTHISQIRGCLYSRHAATHDHDCTTWIRGGDDFFLHIFLPIDNAIEIVCWLSSISCHLSFINDR